MTTQLSEQPQGSALTMGRVLRALIVGLQADTAETVQAAIEEAGFEGLSAADGIEALQLSSEQGVDLIVLGIDMPRLSGGELIKLIWRGAFGLHPPPIMVCGSEDELLRFRASEERALVHAVLKTPLNTDELAQAIFSAAPIL